MYGRITATNEYIDKPGNIIPIDMDKWKLAKLFLPNKV